MRKVAIKALRVCSCNDICTLPPIHVGTQMAHTSWPAQRLRRDRSLQKCSGDVHGVRDALRLFFQIYLASWYKE